MVGSAVGFGLALFGRRPVPQPAMARTGSPLDLDLTETGPSSGWGSGQVLVAEPIELESGEFGSDGYDSGDGMTTRVVPWWQRMLQRDQTAEHVDASDVTLSGWVRVRSGLLLALTVAGLAALFGVVISIVVVGLGLLVT